MKYKMIDKVSMLGTQEEFLKSIKIDLTPDFRDEALALFNSGVEIANPRAAFCRAEITSKDNQSVTIENNKIISMIMVNNAKKTDYCFAFIASCGREMDAWAEKICDPLHKFWADSLRQHALYCAFQQMRNQITAKFKPGKTVVMTPGSIEEWPLKELAVIFDLLAEAVQDLKIDLSEAFLMIPTKSLAGFIIPTDTDYINCKVCPRLDCPDRMAEFEKDYHF